MEKILDRRGDIAYFKPPKYQYGHSEPLAILRLTLS